MFSFVIGKELCIFALAFENTSEYLSDKVEQLDFELEQLVARRAHILPSLEGRTIRVNSLKFEISNI